MGLLPVSVGPKISMSGNLFSLALFRPITLGLGILLSVYSVGFYVLVCSALVQQELSPGPQRYPQCGQIQAGGLVVAEE